MGDKILPEALRIPDLIKNLKDNNLQIDDEEEASRILNEISYYRLIKAYGSSFTNKNGQYNEHTTLTKISRLYDFDDKLRQLLIIYIQRIEITLRCRISNYFCIKYGVLGYLNENNFNNQRIDDENSPNYGRYTYAVLQNRMLTCITCASETPIVKHFKKNYKDGLIPLYAAVELFSFGVLSQFYQTMKNEDKKAIATMYNVDKYYLESWFNSIAYARNLCVHYNRLYKKNLVIKPRLYKNPDDNVNKVNNNCIRIFSVICCMRFLYTDHYDIWDTFVDELNRLLTEYKDVVKPKELGFTKHWETKLRDQKNRCGD